MKKITILLAILTATGLAKAQEIVTDFYHENGKYYNFHNIVEAGDNTFIVQCPVFETVYGPDLGCIFYKVTMEGFLLDSLFIPLNNVPLRTLFEPVPNEDGIFLYGRFEQESDDTALKMTFMDANLDILAETSVEVEDFLSDFLITSSDLFIDPCNDIVASYWCRQRFHMLRIGLDGTIKKRAEVDSISASLMIHERHTGMYDNEAMQYYYIGNEYTTGLANVIDVYVIDSSFHVVEQMRYDSCAGGYFCGGFHEHVMPIGDNSYLLSSRYKIRAKTMVGITKFNKEHEVEAMCMMDETTVSPSPIWTAVMDDGTIYYSYMTDAGNPNILALVCFDSDLNMRWKRYFLDPDVFHWATCMTVMSAGRVAIGAYGYMQQPGRIFVNVIQDNSWSAFETGLPLRPYAFYPNPVQDQLHLLFSPDVKPTHIELYDLQGRLVKTQRNGLESLNLQGLATGTYTMRVALEGGKTFSDKVVKE